MTPHVVGLDLSLTSTGIATPAGLSTVKTVPSHELGRRLDSIRVAVNVAHYERGGPPVLWVIEDILPHHVNGTQALAHVHGAVLHLLWTLAAPHVLVHQSTVKIYATGRGDASKSDIRMAVFQRFGVDVRDDNQADAFVLRAMGCDWLGAPLVGLPETHRRALGKVDWPVTP